MSFATYGDLASTFQTRHLSARLKHDMTRLGLELSTGRKADVATHVAGDFGPVAGIEHSLKLLVAHAESTAEAAILVSGSQTVLGNIQEQAQALSGGLLSAISSQNVGLIQSTAVDAREKFSSVISSLNTNLGDRTLFAGAATDGPALADANSIMSDLMAAISAETTAAGVSSQIDDWFKASGGGFETTGYLGASEELGPFRLRDGETALQPIKASDSEIRDLLSALAKSAVIAEGALAGNAPAQKQLVTQSSNELRAADDQLTLLRARVGGIEARIETASVRNAAEKSALELSYNQLTAADPYETATALQSLYGQMESLYTVTARLSNLNFTDYMR
ncbi:flagellar biosynthesis protein FlgL [Aliiroseovarius sp. S1339]|uniref:flagellin n=1 Tax=Aliiroseovarius sp. S1339 TaxID=2936990 RepID=UPI0020767BBC|nr:flagellin [Aliiroseovarius sp. S1339]MCK8464093.1 flagellar biosynthesis protein FlgL [Aliiroseovarius sp. S1339]